MYRRKRRACELEALAVRCQRVAKHEYKLIRALIEKVIKVPGFQTEIVYAKEVPEECGWQRFSSPTGMLKFQDALRELVAVDVPKWQADYPSLDKVRVGNEDGDDECSRMVVAVISSNPAKASIFPYRYHEFHRVNRERLKGQELYVFSARVRDCKEDRDVIDSILHDSIRYFIQEHDEKESTVACHWDRVSDPVVEPGSDDDTSDRQLDLGQWCKRAKLGGISGQ